MEKRGDSTPSARRVWLRLSIWSGNLIQLAGLVLGCIALAAARATRPAAAAVVEMLAGWVLLYLCCHANAHWFVGRLLGIRFRCYTLGGTGNPRLWPPGLRWLFKHIPFFGVQTESRSMREASAVARALMWSAGVTSSVVVPLLAALWTWQSSIPQARLLLLFTIVWSVGTVLGNLRPGGDYFKARQAFVGPRPNPRHRV